MDRIMMHVEGHCRPLSMSGDFEALPEDSSALSPWSGPPVERQLMGAWEGDAEMGPLSGERGVLVYTSGEVDIEATLGGRDVSRRATAGAVRLMSGDDRPRFRRISGSAEVIVVHLPLDWITRALGEVGGGVFERSASLDRDDTLVNLAREMLAEVKRCGSTGRLYAESLSLAFVRYAGARLGAPQSSGEPTRRALTEVERVRLREYIRNRFHDDVSLTDLASVVGLRPRHFSTLFSRAFGCSPYRFVLNEKLSEAARLLSTTKLDVAEVAYRLGFCNQSHFTVMFRKAYGMTPRKYVASRHGSVS